MYQPPAMACGPEGLSRFGLARRRLLQRGGAGIAWALCCASGAAMADGSRGTLVVRASGFANAEGMAVAKLFLTGDNVLGTGRWERTAAIKDGAAAFRFEELSAGRYAAVVFHDENGNGAIDHGLFGPSEQLGFSGGFVLGLFSGRPDFERLKFDFKPPELTLDVAVR